MKKAVKVVGILIGLYFVASVISNGGFAAFVWLVGLATLARYAVRFAKRVFKPSALRPYLPGGAVFNTWMTETVKPWLRRNVPAAVAAVTMNFGPRAKTPAPNDQPVITRFAA